MSGSDFLELDATNVPRGLRADWLADAIRAAILNGTLPVGAKLPPTRALAADLALSRGTVAEAYQRLTEEALIVARTGSGTIVTARPPIAQLRISEAHTTTGIHDETDNGTDLIDLATGVPDLMAFPRAAWLRSERTVLNTATARQLGYAPAQGTLELRAALSAWLARSRGVVVSPERLIITGGVTGAVSLLAQTLNATGRDTVAIEDPGAEGNARILRYWLPDIIPVPVDPAGLDIDALRATPARAVLVTPAHQYPTGVVLAPDRRRALIDWAERADALVIEDDYDAEYRYDRRPVRAMQSLAPERIAYTASLSKTLAPALRLGWLAVPATLHRQVVELRWATDLGSPALPQLALAQLLNDGTLERHLRTMRVRHRERRDATVTALRTELPGFQIEGIAAGLHLVLRLPTSHDDRQIAATAKEAGVIVQPLSHHYAHDPQPGLIINYAAHHPARLTDAINRLAHIILPP